MRKFWKKSRRESISICFWTLTGNVISWRCSQTENGCLGCSFDRDGEFENYYTYNAAYADTAEQIEQFQYSDKTVWTPLESGGQSPVPKMEAITDMEAGRKAVEYFIHTGKLYPGIDWARQL